MRTPGQDFELAAGFLFSEAILSAPDQVREISYCRTEGPQEYNVVSVRLRDEVAFDPDVLSRNFYVSSSCGVCGKASLEAIEGKGCEPLPLGPLRLAPSVVLRLPDLLKKNQTAFRKTGGLHAAGLFSPEGELQLLREDVGRHNAVDKVIGRAFLDGWLPLEDRVLTVSGRTSFEILQKAVGAGIPAVVAVGAPSTLAVAMARRFNQTLIGFARDGGFNIYSGGVRILDWADPRD